MTRAAPQHQIGEILRAIGAGRLEHAVGVCNGLIAAYPRDPNPLAVLAMARARSGELVDAIGHARKAAELGGVSRTDLRAGLAQLLRSAGRIDEAIAEFQAAAGGSGDPESWYGLALCYEQTRRYGEAKDAARRVLGQKPGHMMARITLARAVRAEGHPEESLLALDEAVSVQMPTVVMVHLQTERGRCLDQLGRYDEAFAAFTKANAGFDAMPETMRINRNAFPEMIAKSKAVIESDAWDARVTHACADDRVPVFVVGFPRSGTTMFEQMLGAHSGVVTSDEAPFIRDVVREIDKLGGHPGALASLDEQQCAALRERYWDSARNRLGADVDELLLVDKQPMNIAYLACIGRVFPNAKVIVVLRDPMDAILSCYMQAFTPNQATVHFSSLKRAADLYARVMDMWLATRDRVGVDWISVRYEDVIDNPKEQITRCLDHIGLSWEAGIESFHERLGRKYVSTPSYQGVGRPISRKSVGRWDRYHGRVEGVLPIVERFRNEFGYGRSE